MHYKNNANLFAYTRLVVILHLRKNSCSLILFCFCCEISMDCRWV